ncbi:MAG: TatD family hydrolase [Phycisphaerales bacterium]
MIDTHCHLTFPDYEGRIDAVLADAAAVGVSGCITISTTTSDCLDALRIARGRARVWCTAGVHPLYSDRTPHRWEALRECGADPKCVAWGELGLDKHYDKPPKEVQLKVLAEQLTVLEGLASEGMDKPVVIHCREAFDELIPILRKSRLDPSRMVFHCFTGGPDDMRLLLDFGASVSFTGVLTYKNAEEVRAAAALVPMDRVMVETDAPFLPPEPVRSKRPNEPKHVVHVARTLAGVHGLSEAEMERVLNENTRRFFGVA